ncbi:patatin-like phospholipase family protein [Bacillus horti]|uniref:NTE family protein n=1 Tax=Caldalkalibacillus horti TaxID=77523 RepID=A0ABT9W1A4_9BACI|nr:patatin-like phospholipase family protein [Bacillus horti]MDQ0166895.1 NTE family protein [Bacillus horti]
MKCDAVFEGGGVKGLAFIGAIQETEKQGYSFNRIAGTSAGSIIASLLAVGYTGKELELMMDELSFLFFLKPDLIGRLPVVGKGLNLLFKNGIYSSIHIEKWLDNKLKAKGVTTFGDLPAGKLKIIVSDISNGRLVIIPDDLHQYRLSWESFPISLAARISSSIPYFFQPYILYLPDRTRIYMVDGGLLSNYPIWLFDARHSPRWPTFGYRLKAAEMFQQPNRIAGPITMFMAIFSTMMEAHDRRHIEEANASRTVFIPVENIKATDFSLTNEQKIQLIELGRSETRQFFTIWNFVEYIEKHRNPNNRFTQKLS